MKIQLSDHFTYKKLIRFTLPSIGMMIFTSIYCVVDGFFVSNFAGETEFTAVNFIMPFLMILGAIGFMFGAGGSALIAKTLGEGKKDKANSLFSLFVYVSFSIGIVISVLGIVLLEPVASLLGAEGELLQNCVDYGWIISLGLPFYMLQMEFQSYMITAEKPQLSLIFTVVAGVTNIILDALFVGAFGWGLEGAAVATITSQFVGFVCSLIYFLRKNSSLLRLGKTSFDFGALVKTCTNGSSELMTNISMSLVGILYNYQLLKYAGESGVAAYGVLMYVNFIFVSVFIGYSIGCAPVIGYHYGAKNSYELKGLLKKSLVIIGVSSVAIVGISLALAVPMSLAFVGYNPALFDMTKTAFLSCSFAFLFTGFAIFGSSFFTALNNGPVSAIISFLRTLLFQTAAVIALPLIFEAFGGDGINGIWLSVVTAEAMAVIVTFAFLLAKRKKYNY